MIIFLYFLILLEGSGKGRCSIETGDINAEANENIEDEGKLIRNSRS